MQLKFMKLREDAVIPSYAKPGDAGLDLTATSGDNFYMYPNQTTFGFGLAVEIPFGYVGLIFPRSSIYKTGMRLSNCVGVIDSGYRGELKAIFDIAHFHLEGDVYRVGDRVAQLVVLPLPQFEIIEADELSITERGTGGYGSTGV
jgi:dUTP pyrophosphatase